MQFLSQNIKLLLAPECAKVHSCSKYHRILAVDEKYKKGEIDDAEFVQYTPTKVVFEKDTQKGKLESWSESWG